MNRKVPVIFVFLLSSVFALAVAPPPLRLFIPFEAAWKGMLETLKEEGWQLTREERVQGFLLTNFREFSSGPLTESHIAKIGTVQKLADAYWEKVEYQYQVQVELLGEKETLVTVDGNIRALKRDFFGKESWVEIASNGEKERELLDRFGKLLFGETFALEKSSKGFWETAPTSIPDMMQTEPSRLPGPERP